MMLDSHGSGLASTTPACWGVERPGLVGGGRVGTLLGPEASGPPLERLGACVVGVVVLVPPFALSCRWVWWGVGGVVV